MGGAVAVAEVRKYLDRSGGAPKIGCGKRHVVPVRKKTLCVHHIRPLFLEVHQELALDYHGVVGTDGGTPGQGKVCNSPLLSTEVTQQSACTVAVTAATMSRVSFVFFRLRWR